MNHRQINYLRLNLVNSSFSSCDNGSSPGSGVGVLRLRELAENLILIIIFSTVVTRLFNIRNICGILQITRFINRVRSGPVMGVTNGQIRQAGQSRIIKISIDRQTHFVSTIGLF